MKESLLNILKEYSIHIKDGRAIVEQDFNMLADAIVKLTTTRIKTGARSYKPIKNG